MRYLPGEICFKLDQINLDGRHVFRLTATETDPERMVVEFDIIWSHVFNSLGSMGKHETKGINGYETDSLRQASKDERKRVRKELLHSKRPIQFYSSFQNDITAAAAELTSKGFRPQKLSSNA